MLSERRGERRMQLGLLTVIALPGVLALGCLLLSFAYPPAAIEAGEHLGPLQGRFAACSGCTLCGMSRAFAAFSHGDFAAAVAFNRGVVLGWPLAWLVVAVSAFGVYRTLREPPRFLPRPSPGARAPTPQEMQLDGS